jgi:ABC-type glycerol-3-phosphate transport system substrate-binding protein
MSGEKPKGKISPSLIIAVVIIIVLLAALVYYATLPPKVEVVPTVVPTTVVQTALKTETLPGTTIVRTEVKTTVQTATPTTPAEKRKLVVWLQPFVDKAEEVIAPMVKKFEEKYNCEVELLTVPYEYAIEKLQTAIAAGQAPDVTYNTHGRYAPIVDFGNSTLPLDDLLEKYKDKFVDTHLLDVTRYKGKLYAAPFGFWSYLWAVNVDILKKAGYSDEFIEKLADWDNKDWNWDTLYEIFSKTTDGKTTWGMAYPGGENWFHPYPLWLWQAGGEIFSPDYTKPTLNSSAAITALSFLKKVHDNGLMAPGSETMKAGEAIAMFTGGKVAVLWGSGGWPANTILTWPKEFPNLNYKVIYPPIGPSGRKDTYLGISLWQIFKQSKNLDLAKAWIEFWYTEEAQVFVDNYFGQFPVIKGVEGKLASHPVGKMHIKAMTYGHVEPIHAKAGEVKTIYNKYTQMVLLGKMTPEEAANEMQKKALESIGR